MSTFVQREIDKRNRWIYFSGYRWTAHAGYWLWVLLFGTVFRVHTPITPSILFNHFLLANLPIAIFFYLYCLFLIPYFFKRNKNLLFWISVITSLIVISSADLLFFQRFVHLTGEQNYNPALGFWKNYSDTFPMYLANFLLFSILLFFMEKNEENDMLLEMEKEKKEIELVKLDLLKTNISPDFIMRSLAQLKKAAIVQEPYTPESIITFSELLRYRLYRGRQLQTPLLEEVQALDNFISFIKFDHRHNNLLVELQVVGAAENKFISALALINLLELFCKTIPKEPATLKLNLDITAEQLYLTITYNKKATDQLLADIEKYGTDYRQLYGSSIQFNFENCVDETCKIDMVLPLVHQITGSIPEQTITE
jgi:two-component system LytT family sensor kinase